MQTHRAFCIFITLIAYISALFSLKSHIAHWLSITAIACLCITQLQAQDLEPRLLSPIPTGGNFAIASYGYSLGNILLDNSLPVDDLDASINSFILAYARSFKLFNKLAKFDAIVPYAFGTYDALVNNVDTSATRTGFGDPLFRLSLVLIGTGAWDPADFFEQEQKKFNLGASIRIRPPLGQYDPTKLINLGANRWTVKLSLAGSYTITRKVILEGHVNSNFFTENSSFYNGNTLKQKPLLAMQFHASYIFKPGIWVAASLGRSFLGETVLNGVEQDDLQKTSRYGFAFAYKLKPHSALKLGFTSGITARYGANFTSIILAYQYIWFNKPK